MTAEKLAAAPEGLAEEAARVRDAGALGRSDQLIRLFEFILACSLAGRSPKEVEVAHEVFNRGGAGEDASVRVYVHRLRRKLVDHYAGRTGPRLLLPRGEYRLVLGDEDAVAERPAAEPPTAEPASAGATIPLRVWRPWAAIAGLLAVLNLLAWIAWIEVGHGPARPEAASRPFWSALDDGKPTAIVTGDYYIFGETRSPAGISRLIRDFSINSREALDQYLLNHPADMGKYVDVDLRYVPTGVLAAALDAAPLAGTGARGTANRADLMTVSQLTPDIWTSQNLVYVGSFSGLGVLADPLLRASGFAISADNNELVDRATRRHYGMEWRQWHDRLHPLRDYVYLASMPGPGGNQIRIIVGTRDAALMHAVEIASDKAELDQLARRVGGAAAFEALYEVRTIHNMNLESTLLVARSLHAGTIWSPTSASPPG